jgi:hypothetical protein
MQNAAACILGPSPLLVAVVGQLDVGEHHSSSRTENARVVGHTSPLIREKLSPPAPGEHQFPLTIRANPSLFTTLPLHSFGTNGDKNRCI